MASLVDGLEELPKENALKPLNDGPVFSDGQTEILLCTAFQPQDLLCLGITKIGLRNTEPLGGRASERVRKL